jgi:hypothetical protein
MASPALVREYYLEALDPGRFDRLDTLLTDDDADHETMIGIPPTRAGLKTKYPGCGSVDRVALTGGGVSGVPSVTAAVDSGLGGRCGSGARALAGWAGDR